jgi:hypothetical protein
MSTTPDWDSWYSETHGGSNRASWELDDDIPDHENMDDEDNI